MLLQTTRSAFLERLGELRGLQEEAADREALHAALASGDSSDSVEPPRVVLHLDLDLGDLGSTWAPVAGDWTHRLYRFTAPRPEADAPGFHTRLLSNLDATLDRQPADAFPHLDREALINPAYAEAFVPGRFMQAGTVAGGYGFYHLALMTGHDARPRDGHPVDTLDHLRLDRLTPQLDEALGLIRLMIDDPASTLPAAFTPHALTQRPGWDGQRSTGSLATRRVTGGLSESRPATDAFLALWPGLVAYPSAGWHALTEPHPADYQPFDLTPTDQHGRFAVVGLRSDVDQGVTTFAVSLDDRQRVRAVGSLQTLVQELQSSLRVDLFSARGFGFTWARLRPQPPSPFSLLRASSDAGYRPNQSLHGWDLHHRFWFLADRATESHLKLFDPTGPTLLGLDEADRRTGIELERFAQPAPWVGPAARDLHQLNESRLAQLRARGVTNADLEILHAQAGRLLNPRPPSPSSAETLSSTSTPSATTSAATADPVALARSLALSQQVYPRLRSTMDDLVYAIVVLLLLTIPFSFAVERLAIGAVGVYGRITGFVIVFLLTFVVLYFTHPGFAIASTPVMIFLAFAILLLSIMVIWLLVRRFAVELREMQLHPPPLFPLRTHRRPPRDPASHRNPGRRGETRGGGRGGRGGEGGEGGARGARGGGDGGGGDGHVHHAASAHADPPDHDHRGHAHLHHPLLCQRPQRDRAPGHLFRPRRRRHAPARRVRPDPQRRPAPPWPAPHPPPPLPRPSSCPPHLFPRGRRIRRRF